MKLSKLEDYVFLSDRNSQINFIVERDGTVWRPEEFPEAYFIKGRQHNVLLNWKDYIKDKATWKWRDGYLPVLEISDRNNLLEFVADNDTLLMRINHDEVLAFPDNTNTVTDRFASLIERHEKYWNDFFSDCWQPPESDAFPESAWRACLVQALNSFCGAHPKYGACYYNRNYHDGFPPTTISMVDTLIDYGQYGMALEFLAYYLKRFIMPDGSIDYYGPALSEYGMLLNLTGKIVKLPDGKSWLHEHWTIWCGIARYLYRARNIFVNGKDAKYRLLAGVPEADTRDEPAIYTHNNAWAWRGLRTWSETAAILGMTEASEEAVREADDIHRMLNIVIQEMPMPDGLVPARFDRLDTIKTFTQDRETSYANYRYYPELLHSMFLPVNKALEIIEAREQRQGELEGMTLFHFLTAWKDLPTAPFCCNNWPIASYGIALAELGEKKRLERLLTGHFKYHQTQDTFTSYENVDAEVDGIRRAFTDWCVPAQLTFPRLLRHYYNLSDEN
jgi:hypothetical protein